MQQTTHQGERVSRVAIAIFQHAQSASYDMATNTAVAGSTDADTAADELFEDWADWLGDYVSDATRKLSEGEKVAVVLALSGMLPNGDAHVGELFDMAGIPTSICESCHEVRVARDVVGIDGDPNSQRWCGACRGEE